MEEELWLQQVKEKLNEFISSKYWKNIRLSKIEECMIEQITEVTTVKDLSTAINERTVNTLFELLSTKLKKAKKLDSSKEY